LDGRRAVGGPISRFPQQHLVEFVVLIHSQHRRSSTGQPHRSDAGRPGTQGTRPSHLA
jgi:hypothetical protein